MKKSWIALFGASLIALTACGKHVPTVDKETFEEAIKILNFTAKSDSTNNLAEYGIFTESHVLLEVTPTLAKKSTSESYHYDCSTDILALSLQITDGVTEEKVKERMGASTYTIKQVGDATKNWIIDASYSHTEFEAKADNEQFRYYRTEATGKIYNESSYAMLLRAPYTYMNDRVTQFEKFNYDEEKQCYSNTWGSVYFDNGVITKLINVNGGELNFSKVGKTKVTGFDASEYTPETHN